MPKFFFLRVNKPSVIIFKMLASAHDYVAGQCDKLKNLVHEFAKNQLIRIQKAESKTRLSILFYGLLENTLTISIQTQNLLTVFRESFEMRNSSNVLSVS